MRVVRTDCGTRNAGWVVCSGFLLPGTNSLIWMNVRGELCDSCFSILFCFGLFKFPPLIYIPCRYPGPLALPLCRPLCRAVLNILSKERSTSTLLACWFEPQAAHKDSGTSNNGWINLGNAIGDVEPTRFEYRELKQSCPPSQASHYCCPSPIMQSVS